MQDTKLPLRTWFLAMKPISSAQNGVAVLELRRQLGVSCPTAWMLQDKLTQAMHLS
jgi:hypothetical protein